MTSHDADELGDTLNAQAVSLEETACIADATDTECAQLAWSLEGEAAELSALSAARRSRSLAAVLLPAAVLIIACVVGAVGWMLVHDKHGAAGQPATSTSGPPAPLSPVTTPAALDDQDPGANERAFLQALRRAAIVIPDHAKAMSGAHWVCDKFRDGYTRADIVATLKRNNPELTDLGAVDFMAAAIVFYCPQYA